MESLMPTLVPVTDALVVLYQPRGPFTPMMLEDCIIPRHMTCGERAKVIVARNI